MTGRARRRRVAAAGAAFVVAAGLAACGNDDSADASGEGEDVTLRVNLFGRFGYADLYQQFEDDHPGVTIVETAEGDLGQYNTQLTQRIAAGSGAGDVVAIEEGQVVSFLQNPANFVNLQEFGAADNRDQWLEWKFDQATTADGEYTIGLGTDVGGLAMCYRPDLFEQAGLPTDREEVAALMGTWEDYFATGEKFAAAMPDTAWYDSSGGVAQAMLNQVDNPFEADDDTIQADNPELKAVWEAVTGNVDTLSSRMAQWSDDWTASFQNDGFATMACPGWMLGIIEGNAEGVEGWDIADVFPGGGGNWGGSYLTVPAQGDHTEEAKEVAAWLTAPEQQVVAFKDKKTFPSQVDAYSMPDVTDAVEPFFNEAPVGQILANRAAAVTVQPHKGPKYSDILQAFQAGILRVDDGSQSPDESWEQFQADVEALG
jgi:cellobiose transport system substrate-binding protein